MVVAKGRYSQVAVGKRLDWAGTQFSNGTNRVERGVAHASDDLGYLVQTEHLRYRVGDRSS